MLFLWVTQATTFLVVKHRCKWYECRCNGTMLLSFIISLKDVSVQVMVSGVTPLCQIGTAVGYELWEVGRGQRGCQHWRSGPQTSDSNWHFNHQRVQRGSEGYNTTVLPPQSCCVTAALPELSVAGRIQRSQMRCIVLIDFIYSTALNEVTGVRLMCISQYSCWCWFCNEAADSWYLLYKSHN